MALSLADSYDGVIPSDTGRAGAAFRVSFTMNLAIFLPGKPFRVNVSNFVRSRRAKRKIFRQIFEKIFCKIVSAASMLGLGLGGQRG